MHGDETVRMDGEDMMNLIALFRRACISGCVCSIFYHGLMLVMGKAVTVKQAVVFTAVFIVLYFFWLVLVSRKNSGK